MTQMGLEYEKLLESRRHNQADESIRHAANEISQQDADTRSYSASFEPQRVSNDTIKAQASSKDADTRRLAHELNSAYAERDMQQKEMSARANQLTAQVRDREKSPELLERAVAASERQADARLTAAEAQVAKNEIDRMIKLIDRLPEQLRVYEAGSQYGGTGYGIGATALNQYNSLVDDINSSINQLRSIFTKGMSNSASSSSANGLTLSGEPYGARKRESTQEITREIRQSQKQQYDNKAKRR